MELSGVIVVPLRVQGRVAGALSMFASRYSGRKYTLADVEFAEEVGRRASIALITPGFMEKCRGIDRA